MPERRSYPRDQSRLYKVKSPAQLADIFFLQPHELDLLLDANENYIRWTDKKTGREIQRPKPLLEKVHRRAGMLLSRIETPDFLHSAIKGRSYISNAQRHMPDEPTAKIDVRKFYPSARAQAVFHFFRDRMLCDGDVAGMLARLLTVDGHLATGSSVSPILSFFAYEDMFTDIEALAIERGCEMTCYVDDMVFTGPGATRRLIYDIIQIVRQYRLWGHKTKLFKPGQPKVITGVAVIRVGQRLPNRRQKTIADEMDVLKSTRDDAERLAIIRRLLGRLYEAAQVDSSWYVTADAMADEKRGLERRSARA
ncbi:MAG: RNA-directed DNA polymerase [Alphaproteobacteria bacterium]|nr:MAG: RNA-directed DNA polymerase [Alphaproteobacteria bacterium]